MRNLKMLALAAVAASALMAFIGAGTASATVLCSTTTGNNPCPTAQKWFNQPLLFSLTPETSLLLKETGGSTFQTCKGSEIGAEITNTGSSTETVTGKFTKSTLTSCTFPHTTTALGGFEIHRIAGTSNGTVTVDGVTKTTINTVFFGTCVYGVENGKSLGDITEGKPAILHINAVKKKMEGSNVACPETLLWTATYTLTSPKETTLSVSDSTD